MAFTDNFNRASLGAAWETVQGTAWVTASSLYLKPVQQYVNTGVRVVGSFPNDQYAEVYTEVINDPDYSIMGPAVRLDGTGANCYYVQVFQASLDIYKRVAGTSTYLNGTVISLSYATLYKVKLVVTGTSLEAFLSDVSTVTTTDSAVTAGNPGCYGVTGQTSTMPRFDDFASTDLIVAGGAGRNRTLLGVG